MQTFLKLVTFSLLTVVLVACGGDNGTADEENEDSGKGEEVIQVIVEMVDEQGEFADEKRIEEKDAVQEITEIVQEVTFEEGMMGIAVMPDLRFSLIESTTDEDIQEDSHSFEVRFNRDIGTGSIKDDRGRYGELDKEQTDRLMELLQAG